MLPPTNQSHIPAKTAHFCAMDRVVAVARSGARTTATKPVMSATKGVKRSLYRMERPVPWRETRTSPLLIVFNWFHLDTSRNMPPLNSIWSSKRDS